MKERLVEEKAEWGRKTRPRRAFSWIVDEGLVWMLISYAALGVVGDQACWMQGEGQIRCSPRGPFREFCHCLSFKPRPGRLKAEERSRPVHMSRSTISTSSIGAPSRHARPADKADL